MMEDPLPTEARVIDLEIRLMHQEATLQELNECLIRQQKAIEVLTLQVRVLQEQLRAGISLAHPSEETPPPHY